jgi:hypothetical protein
MSLYSRLRVDIRSERAAADLKETEKHIKKRVAEHVVSKGGVLHGEALPAEHETPV